MSHTEEEQKSRKRKASAKYLANPENRTKRAIYQQRIHRERIEWLQQYKVKQGCIDCGYNVHHAALQFDHREMLKAQSINRVSWGSMGVKRRDEELAKCDVRCSNCHDIRHYNLRQADYPT